jgi:hypothetical protein
MLSLVRTQYSSTLLGYELFYSTTSKGSGSKKTHSGLLDLFALLNRGVPDPNVRTIMTVANHAQHHHDR